MNGIDIAEEIGRLIEANEFQPGERLREQALADRFGTSRGPVREALKILASRFQVRFEPQVGAVVPLLSPDEVVELYELRGAILGVCAYFAASRGSDEELAAIHTQAKRLLPLSGKKNATDAFLEGSAEWRHLVVRAAHSERLSVSYDSNGLGASRFMWRTQWNTAKQRQKLAEDWLICSEHLLARNGGKAQAVANRAYKRFAREIQKLSASLSLINRS